MKLHLVKKINIQKSEIFFGKGLSVVQRQELTDFLAMKLVDIHPKYLGVPTPMRRSKKIIFSEMKDRIWKKLQGWKEKQLSRAGKEVLLKSAVQAIPTYLMSSYNVLLTIVK
ncbi:uncharacterized protein LOC125498812 [Beta vulgaris subsp. vulgaris]|uniref:uncharacterized protein LOC125498812 n=1 Tax=Beta vulgaris subsp. vulgaris TaxID=3555 RepID=UPI0020374FDC|nr:uncharacterized protein LOC125498812 [Beta vulgaris subsp. vulgaris]